MNIDQRTAYCRRFHQCRHILGATVTPSGAEPVLPPGHLARPQHHAFAINGLLWRQKKKP